MEERAGQIQKETKKVNEIKKSKASANSGRIWRVMRNVIFIVLLLVFVLQIVLTVWIQKSPEVLVKKMPVRLLEITSDSMYPKLKVGDGVVETNAEFSSLKTGDMVTFYQSGDLITHEVIAINEDGTIVTEGVANGIPDNAIAENAYVGKVAFRIPGLSRFLSLSYGTVRKVIWILLFIVIIFGPDLVSKVYDLVETHLQTRKQKH